MNESQRSEMCVLHLANDFAGSKVYRNLFSELDGKYGIRQLVYTALRSKELIGGNKIDFTQGTSRIFYRPILNTMSRVLFGRKISKVVKDVEQCVDLKEVDMIHAHTWYSDGAVAYLLSIKYNIPYIVTVRSSDTEIFFRYMMHLRAKGKKILENAKNVIFIAPVYANRVLNHKYFESICSQLEKKHYVIPNGIDDFWLSNLKDVEGGIHGRIRLIYVGTFLKRKNVVKVIDAVEYLRGQGVDVSLTLVGGGGADHDRIMHLIKDKACYKYVGKISDQAKLKELYNEADIFVMPSVRETFGLVYLEAISQGLPIIYLANDSIDGLFDATIGVAINKSNIEWELPQAIKLIARNIQDYSFSGREVLQGFGWSELAAKYMKLYRNLN